MSGNSFGKNLILTSFGESHGKALGLVLDGFPSQVKVCEKLIYEMLQRRRPGTSKATSTRDEKDEIQILSGVFEGQTLGTPIAAVVYNEDARSKDYEAIKTKPRTGHADDVWKEKFGHSDHRGGGRSSGRETISRVIGGAFAKMLVQKHFGECNVFSSPVQIGPKEIHENEQDPQGPYGLKRAKWNEIEKMLLKAKEDGDSYGGIAQVKIKNPPKSLGQPVFHKLKADLAAAMLGVGAVSAFELSGAREAATMKGTEFHKKESSGEDSSYGGIRGGLSTGEDISLKLTVKPTSSILDVAKAGRHDPCILLRALVVYESMAWLTLADHLLWSRLDRS
jgi:chorismate synthase